MENLTKANVRNNAFIGALVGSLAAATLVIGGIVYLGKRAYKKAKENNPFLQMMDH